MDKLTITAICPTFNSSNFIQRTLSSIISQERLPDELIISDDGSTDNTLDIIKNFFKKNCDNINCIILENSHKGPGAARNSAIRASTSDWIAFIDSDDTWEPMKLKNLEEHIIKDRKLNFLCHDEHWIKNGSIIKSVKYGSHYNPKTQLLSQLYIKNMFSTSAVICKKDLLIDYGLFDEDLLSSQDYELWLRLSTNINLKFIREFYGCYVIRSGNITSGNKLKRFKNEIFIALKYRLSVGNILFALKILKIFLSYFKQIILKK